MEMVKSIAIRVDEAAAILGVERSQLLDDAKAGRIPSKKLGSLYLFSRAVIEDMKDRYPRRPRGCEITYFIQAETGGLIKIGMTRNLTERLALLQLGCPQRLVCIGWLGRNIEAGLHRRFKRYREHGEWFYPHPDILRFIEEKAVKTPW